MIKFLWTQLESVGNNNLVRARNLSSTADFKQHKTLWVSKYESDLGGERGKLEKDGWLAGSQRGWTNEMTNIKAAAKIYQHLALGGQ